jgi:5-hydroxyisourate hydrolase
MWLPLSTGAASGSVPPGAGTGCRARSTDGLRPSGSAQATSRRRALRSSGVRQARFTPGRRRARSMAPISPISIKRRHCRAFVHGGPCPAHASLLVCRGSSGRRRRRARRPPVARRGPGGGVGHRRSRRDDGAPQPGGPRRMAESSILSTHVLNVAQGVPADGVSVELWRLAPAESWSSGPPPAPTAGRSTPAAPGRLRAGSLRTALRRGASTSAAAGMGADPPFHDVGGAARLPRRRPGALPCAAAVLPWSYTTYRGS